MSRETLYKDVQFKAVNDINESKIHLKAVVKGESFIIAHAVQRKNYYARNLEMHHKPLVDVYLLMDGLANLLEAFAKIDVFSEGVYEGTMELHKLFLDKRMSYEALADRIKVSQSTSGWVC